MSQSCSCSITYFWCGNCAVFEQLSPSIFPQTKTVHYVPQGGRSQEGPQPLKDFSNAFNTIFCLYMCPRLIL